MKRIQLDSGFVYDYTNMMLPGGVTEADVTNLGTAISDALAAAEETRHHGVVKGHLSKDGEPELVLFPQLPYVVEGHINNPTVMARLDALRNKKVSTVVSFGIGGSFLGGKVLFDVHCGEFWNSMSDEERNYRPRMYFSGNNVDPVRTQELIKQLQREWKEQQFLEDHAHVPNEYKVLLVLISKSGSTIEPMTNFMIVKEALEVAMIDYEVLVVTDPRNDEKETLLHKLAVAEGWGDSIFAVPDGIGGRFSVFSEVGLVIGALLGFDIHAYLEGAKAADIAAQEQDVWKNPALLSAVLKYIGSEQYGRHIEVFMPYADRLKSLSEWYVQ